MVEAMGGNAIWRDLGSVHFVHEWEFFDRIDRYIEHEILDLTAPRSYVTMDSEIYSRIRAYSPENRYWNIVDGEFSYASDEALANSLERAPFSIYRIARAVAAGDSAYHVSFGRAPGVEDHPALEFRGADGVPRGWILLNARHEPVIWATTQYRYSFGPMERYGNLRVPKWAMTRDGLVRYEMVSLEGRRSPPDPELFVPPRER
jgi:hypothetical protein